MLLNFARENECKEFIYASTMSVYGEQPDLPVKENAYLRPKSFYGVGKIASEHYLRLFQEYGMNCTALRLFNVYGPGQNMENLRQGMVSIFLAQAIKKKHVHIKGSPDRFRDFIYIDDVINAFIAAFEKKIHRYDELNISTGIKTTVGELINKIVNNLPFNVTIEYTGSTQGDQHGIVGDISQTKKILNWEPKITLKSGIKLITSWWVKLNYHR